MRRSVVRTKQCDLLSKQQLGFLSCIVMQSSVYCLFPRNRHAESVMSIVPQWETGVAVHQNYEADVGLQHHVTDFSDRSVLFEAGGHRKTVGASFRTPPPICAKPSRSVPSERCWSSIVRPARVSAGVGTRCSYRRRCRSYRHSATCPAPQPALAHCRR